MKANRESSEKEHKILKAPSQKIYGIWTDLNNAIEFKIFPTKRGAGIKIWSLSDLSTIKRIAMICGLDQVPKRKNWKGFDLVTHLDRKEDFSLLNGFVNMPNSKRRNLLDVKLLSNDDICLDFFYQTFEQFEVIRNACGTIQIRKLVTKNRETRNPLP